MPLEKTTKVILSISKTKRGEYLVTLPKEKLLLSEDSFTDFPLYKGKELSSNEYIALKKAIQLNPLKSYASNLLSRREYSISSFKKKLEAKFPGNEYIPEIIYSFKSAGLLDDKVFALDYKESKEAQLYGQERILQDLQFKEGIAPSVLSTLSFKEEKEHAESFLSHSVNKYKSLPLAAKKRKLQEALIRRGYSSSLSNELLSSLKEDHEQVLTSLRRDATNATKRYERKYNGYALKEHLYAFLRNKGYQSEDINQVIEESTYGTDC